MPFYTGVVYREKGEIDAYFCDIKDEFGNSVTLFSENKIFLSHRKAPIPTPYMEGERFRFRVEQPDDKSVLHLVWACCIEPL